MNYKMDDKFENRKADNRFLENSSKELDECDEQISFEKNRLEELSEMQESTDAITDNINECIELLSKSIKGPSTENLFNDMYNTSKTFQVNASNNIENNRLESRKKLNELYQEKEKILEKNREKSQNKNKE